MDPNFEPSFFGCGRAADVVNLSDDGRVTIGSTTVTCNARTQETSRLYCACEYKLASFGYYVVDLNLHSLNSSGDDAVVRALDTFYGPSQQNAGDAEMSKCNTARAQNPVCNAR